MKKTMKKELVRNIVETIMEAKVDSTTESMFFDFPVGDIDLHVDGHYGHGGETVYVMAAWLGDYDVDQDGNTCIPDDAPYIWGEVASPGDDSCWRVDPALVEQLVKDILRYV